MNASKYIERAKETAHDINCYDKKISENSIIVDGKAIKIGNMLDEEFNNLVETSLKLYDKLDEYERKISIELSKEEFRAYRKEVKRIIND